MHDYIYEQFIHGASQMKHICRSGQMDREHHGEFKTHTIVEYLQRLVHFLKDSLFHMVEAYRIN